MYDKRKGFNGRNKKEPDSRDYNDVYSVVNKNNLKNRNNDYAEFDDEQDYDVYDDNDDYDDYQEYDEYDEYDDYEGDNYDDYENRSEEKKGIEIYPVRAKRPPYKPQMKKKKKSPVKKFFIIVFSILFVYIAIFGGYIAYTYLDNDPKNDYFKKENIISSIGNIVSKEEIPEKITVLLTGVDEDYSRDGTRTDTIMVACFDSVNKKLSLISIPRDTSVEVPDDRFEVMKKNVPNLGTNKIKINSVYTYGGEQGMEFLKKQAEELLGIEIDYYAKINFKGFVYLIDSIGGVKFNVEERCYYNDKAGFVVDLYPGEQVLDGDKAIQLVRFRSGYARADLRRVEVQRDFLKAFLSQALKKESIVSNPQAYINTIIEYVDTDITVGDISTCLSAIEGFDGSNVKGYTLPGSPEYRKGVSYYNCNSEETKKLIDEIYNNKTDANTVTEETKETSKDKRIIILNGGKTAGLAKKASNMLKEKGFNIISFDNAKNSSQDTKIYVCKDGQGQDLSEFFTTSQIIVDETQCKNKNCDILIILGKNEKLAEGTNG